MTTYAQEITAAINPNDRVIFLTVGPSGGGKSHLTDQLKKLLPGLVVHSLDDYRIQCNNGKYPENTQVHDRINQIAIPMYRDSVLKETSNLILLDNTHLRWDPDWQLPIQKAKLDNYDIFPIIPPVTEHLLHTCRSTHIGTGQSAADIFRKMCARWPGSRMGHLLNRRISHDVLDDVFPNKPDSFSVNKMFHINWGSGFIYVLDNYLGYVNRDMVIHAIKAGNHLRKVAPDTGDLFLRKDSLLHITLIPPGQMNTDVLKAVAKQLVQKPPPVIEYVGVQQIEEASTGNRLVFLAISAKSNVQWKYVVDNATRKNPSVFNPDGIHVTLGFQKSDVWGIDKTTPPPKYPIKEEEWNMLQEVFDWTIRSPLTERNLSSETGSTEIFLKMMKDEFPQMEALQMPEALREKLSLLVSHPEVRHKWKGADSVKTQVIMGKEMHHRFHSLSLQVSPPRFRSDDETYKRYPTVLRILPRGLTVVFDCHPSDATTVKYVNAVYPTPKFFGDNDLEEDVDVISDSDLQSYASTREPYIVTEKSNGEMFTFTVICKDDSVPEEEMYLIAMGSKNNKFLFKVHPGFVEDSIDEGIQAQLRSEGKLAEYNARNMTNSEWTNMNLWVEMCMVFAAKLGALSTEKVAKMFDYLLQNGMTLCGEFESYLHPHLISFPKNHQRVIFFAVTGHNDVYECSTPDALENLRILQKLRDEYALDIVSHYETKETIMEIKDSVRLRKGSEGVVVLVVKEGKVVDRVKLKTIWYVVHRGFREKLRKMIVTAAKTGKGISADYVVKILTTTLKDKLNIFSLDTTWKDAQEYTTYIGRVARYVETESNTSVDDLKNLFLYDYPKFVEKGGSFSPLQPSTQAHRTHASRGNNKVQRGRGR